MLKRKQSGKQTEVAIFKIHIDFNSEARKHCGPLLPDGEYDFLWKHNDRTIHASYEEIVKLATDVINNELIVECNKCIFLSVNQIKVIEAYQGSIEILFSVIFDTLGVISGLKDLYDCIELIRELTNIHVRKRLESRYGDNFDVETWTVVPKGKMHDYRKPYAQNTNQPITAGSCKRDAFFYYLLISNLVLLTIIILLVYKAVITMYW